MSNPEKTITITEKEYNQLIKDQEFLQILQAAGVDNWDGYDYALEHIRLLRKFERK